jgi:calcineurin-like phosphoesterase family protein
MRIRLITLTVLCALSIAVSAAEYQWDDVPRVIAIGDVHGAYPELVSILQAAQVIDAQSRWVGGTTHLVSLGDLLDRGPQSLKAMDLFMRLQGEARSSGGYVHVLLGNHEVMNLTGDLRDVSDEEYEAFNRIGGHTRAFALDGPYGRWLTSLPFVIRINDSIFAHGGFSSLLRNTSLEQINREATEALVAVLSEGKRLREEGALPPAGDLLSMSYNLTEEQTALLGETFLTASSSPLLGNFSPHWYRGTALCHKLLEEKSYFSTLQHLGARRGVMGHTPTPNREVNARFSGSALMIDTGMLASVYKGNARGLEILLNEVRAFGPDGASEIINLPSAYPTDALLEYQYVSKPNDDGSVELALQKGAENVRARFLKLNKRDRNRAIAAYRLDRLLGLHMVPTTVIRTVNDREGVVVQWDNRYLSERQRAANNQLRPNYCEQGSDYHLLAAFDALIGKLDRSADNLWYDRSTWQIRLADNHQAFGTKTRLPQYATPPGLPQPMAEALQTLTFAELSNLLAGLLKSAEIKALLKRRDSILDWPVSSG